MTNYQTPFLDQSWRDFSHYSSQLRSNPLKPLDTARCPPVSTPALPPDYLGRSTQNIIVWDDVSVQSPIIKSGAANRSGCVLFWWAYTLFAIVVFFTTEKKKWLPKWFHKLLFSIEYGEQPLVPWWKCKNITTFIIKGTKKSTTTESIKATTSVKIHITVLNVVQLLTQLVSIGAMCGNILSHETQNVYRWSILSQEPFTAVGQWGNLAVVLLILIAAGIRRVWAVTEAENTAIEGHRELEVEIEDWNLRIGYAS